MFYDIKSLTSAPRSPPLICCGAGHPGLRFCWLQTKKNDFLIWMWLETFQVFSQPHELKLDQFSKKGVNSDIYTQHCYT